MHHVNKHTVELEPPDVVHNTLRGPILPEEMAELGWCVLQLSKDRPYLLLIADISAFAYEGTTSESRRVAADISRSIPYRGTAFCGGSGAQRFVVNFSRRRSMSGCACLNPAIRGIDRSAGRRCTR